MWEWICSHHTLYNGCSYIHYIVWDEITDTFPHDDVIKWKHFPRYWPFVRGIHRSPVNSPHKGQWRGALMLTLICARIKGWVNNREAGDFRRYRGHYDVIVMKLQQFTVEVWEWISNFIPHYWTCDYLSMLGLKLNHVSKMGSQHLLWVFKRTLTMLLWDSAVLFNGYLSVSTVY